MTHSAFDTAAVAGQASPANAASSADSIQNPTFQAFLKKALELGTESALLAKSARRNRLLKLLRPVDYLTRTGIAPRAGAIALFWSPLVAAIPYIYNHFGLDAIVYHCFLPASLFTAMLFWAVKTLQKSPWTPILKDTEYAVELERTVSELGETRQLRDAILQSRQNLYVADLRLLAAYNRKRQSEGKPLAGG
jgi:hypothetical protein